jgi:hypothetical protein
LWEILIILVVGFIAQMIDGTLGMAYGVTSNSFLLSLGFLPAAASATVHTAEIFTTAVSGASHFKLGNVDKKLFKSLVIPGSVAAVFGAYVLVNFPTELITNIVSFYLIIMGAIIMLRAFGINLLMKKIDRKILAGIGGFVDAVGGGGWGPIVTSTLIANGENPKKAIGSVNLAEFFVTITQAATFYTLIGIAYPEAIIGLLIGGVIAAPIAAYVCKKAPAKPLMIAVGILIIFLNVRKLLGV